MLLWWQKANRAVEKRVPGGTDSHVYEVGDDASYQEDGDRSSGDMQSAVNSQVILEAEVELELELEVELEVEVEKRERKRMAKRGEWKGKFRYLNTITTSIF